MQAIAVGTNGSRVEHSLEDSRAMRTCDRVLGK
jgi:hypothetical protein